MRRRAGRILSLLTVPDLILIGVILGGSGLGLWFVTLRGEGGRVCVVEVEGKRVYEIPLSGQTEFEVVGPLGATRIEVANGTVRVVDSPCPLRLCVKTGRISKTNQFIVCLPNRVVVKIEGGKSGVDAVTW